MIKFTCNSQSKKSCWLLYDFAFLPPEVLNIIFCLDWGGQEFINTLPSSQSTDPETLDDCIRYMTAFIFLHVLSPDLNKNKFDLTVHNLEIHLSIKFKKSLIQTGWLK